MNNQSLQEKTIFIDGPAGEIETLIEIPSQSFHRVAIICHPHPLYGGSMRNKVVHTLAKTLRELDIATVQFNFRGVGKSAGHYANGEGETDDLIAVLAWIKQQYPHHALWLAGFSFGAYIALKASLHCPIEQLILVAPPVEHFPVATLPLPPCSLIIVQGDADEIVPPQMVFDWVKTLSPPPTLIHMQNASHFFHGRLGELRMNLLEVLK